MLNVFLNHFNHSKKYSVINLGISRLVISLYLIWAISTTSFTQINKYSMFQNYGSVPTALGQLIPNIMISNVHILALLTIVVLILFGLGFKTAYTGYVSSFLVCYMGLIRYQMQGTFSTHMYFAAGVLIMFYAFYSEEDLFSIDGYLRSNSENLLEFIDSILENRRHQHTLSYFLLILGILYFGSGFAKLGVSGPEWMSPTNFGRHVFRPRPFGGYFPELRDMILQFDYLLLFMAVITIFVEILFIFSIIFDKYFNVFVFCIISFHVGVAFIMGPVFVYTMVFLSLFLNWEYVINRFVGLEST